MLWGKRREEQKMMIQRAQQTANTALSEIRGHVQTCEKDNRDIKATLKAQDDVLSDIRTGLRFLKWVGGVVAFIVPFVELWRAMH